MVIGNLDKRKAFHVYLACTIAEFLIDFAYIYVTDKEDQIPEYHNNLNNKM